MAAIPNFGAENTSATTSTDDVNWTDVVSYTFEDTDQVASATYAVFWQGAFGYTSTSNDYQVQVVEGATPRASLNIEPKEVTTPVDRDQQGGFFFFTAAGTPADATFKLQIKLEVASGTVTAHNGHIRIVKLPANSVWAETTGEQTLASSTTYTDVTGASVSGLGGTDWLILASAEVRFSVITNAVGVQLAGTGVTAQSYYSGASDNTNYTSVMLASKGASIADAKVQFAQHTSDTALARIRNVRILALKTSDFRNIWSNFQGFGNIASTTYTTRNTLTQTAAAGDHLVIGMAALHSNSTSISSYARLTSGGSQIDEYIRESGNATQPWGTPAGQIIRLENYTAGSRTWTIDRKSEAANNTSLDWSGIAVIDLDNGASGAYSLTAAAAAYTSTPTAATLKVGRKAAAATSSFSYSATAATLKRGLKLTAAAASYSYSAIAAGLRRSRKLTAATTSYSFNPTAATLRRGIPLVAGVASYNYSATAADLRLGRKLIAASTTFTFTPAAATLRTTKVLAAAPTSFTFTPTPATFRKGYTLAVTGASFSVSVTPATLLWGRKLTAGPATFAFSPSAATLTHAVVGAYTLVADGATFTVTSAATGLRTGRRLVAAGSSYSFTPAAATLSRARRLVAGSAAFTFAAASATLRYTSSTNNGPYGQHYPVRGIHATPAFYVPPVIRGVGR